MIGHGGATILQLVSGANDAADMVQIAQALDDARQMNAPLDQNGQVDDREPGVALLDPDALDIGVGIGDQAGQFGDQAAPGLDLDPQRYREILIDLLRPGQRDQLVGIVAQLVEVTTLVTVDDDPLADPRIGSLSVALGAGLDAAGAARR